MTFRSDSDGTTLASADDDTVRIWNILSGDCLHRLSVGSSSFFFDSFYIDLLFRLSMIYLALFNLYPAIVVYWLVVLFMNSPLINGCLLVNDHVQDAYANESLVKRY